MSGARRLALFARVPEAGRVKTRLIPRFGAADAARLHLAFVADSAARFGGENPWELVVYSAGEGEMPGLASGGIAVRRQCGADLGARLLDAFASAQAEGVTAMVVLGSDSPDLPLGRIRAAFAALETSDVVIGPATDGGYYLIGARAPAPALLTDIPWGESRVFALTAARARAAGLATTLLEPWYDIDRPDDVEFLAAHLGALQALSGEDRAPRSRRLLAELGLVAT